jgi:hypothetical protein
MDAEASLDGILEGLSRCLDADSARRVVEFRVGEQIQTRIDQLAAEANEGTLDAHGRSEYESLINASDFVSILKLKARQRLRTDAA